MESWATQNKPLKSENGTAKQEDSDDLYESSSDDGGVDAVDERRQDENSQDDTNPVTKQKRIERKASDLRG